MPEKAPNDFRLIHHLSYPGGSSINDGQEHCSVQHQIIDSASQQIKQFGVGTLMAKTDVENAFLVIHIHPEDQCLLGFSLAGNYYHDILLSCGLFRVTYLKKPAALCNGYLKTSKMSKDVCISSIISSDSYQVYNALLSFYELANSKGKHIKERQNVFPTTTITFLGLELALEIRLPPDKLVKHVQT